MICHFLLLKAPLRRSKEKFLLYITLHYMYDLHIGSDEFGSQSQLLNLLQDPSTCLAAWKLGRTPSAQKVQPGQKPASAGREQHHHMCSATDTLRQAPMLKQRKLFDQLGGG